MCASFFCEGVKIGIRVVIGFRGMLLLLRVQLSWVCDKIGFNGGFVVVILVLENNGK